MVATGRVRFNPFIPVIVIFLLFIAGFFLYSNFFHQPSVSASASATMITQNNLEEKYGLRVNLLAVTAAGGMVDLRLKFMDGEKAKTLLQDKKNFPALRVAGNPLTLSVDEETKSQEMKFDNNGGLFLLFSNSGNAVKPGSAVKVVFGDIELEPVVVR